MQAPANSSVNYQALEQERTAKSKAVLRQKLKAVSENDLGKAGSLRRVILGLVVGERYDAGKEELQAHVERKTEYPSFQKRVEKMVKHSVELIQAIQTKRTFPGLGSLSLSKQQELNERVLTHFEELKHTLKAIERAEKDIKLADLRSTTWLARTVGHAVVLLALAHIVLSLNGNVANSFMVVFDSLVEDVSTHLFKFLGW